MILLQFCNVTKFTRIVPIEAKKIFKDFQASLVCYQKIAGTGRQVVK